MNYCARFKNFIISILVIALSLIMLTGCDISETLAGITDVSDAEEPYVITVNNDEENVIIIEEEEEIPQEEVPAEPEYVEIYDDVNKEYSVKPTEYGKLTLGFVGDIGFSEGYSIIRVFRDNGSDVNNSIEPEVLSTLQGVDIMMANNEFPYSDKGAPLPDKTYTFRAKPESAGIMKDLGVDIVSLANNHAYDYGPDALIDTIDILNEIKLPFVGAGKNIEEAKKPAYFHVYDKVISFVSATQIERFASPDTKEATESSPGVLRTLDPGKFVDTISTANENSDFVVVYVHWGSESTDLVEKSQRDLAQAYVDAGADLIIGDHSHCLQGIDYIGDVPVFYSLGNFWFNSKTMNTCVVTAELDEEFKLSEVKFIPCIQQGCGVKDATAEEKLRIIEYMRGISNYATLSDEGILSRTEEDNNIQHGMNTSPYRKIE